MPAGLSIMCPQCRQSNAPGSVRCSACKEFLSVTAEHLVDSADVETRALDEGERLPAPVNLGTWGPFRLLEKVGQGSFGEVYRAFDTTLEREVALKLLLPRFGSAGEDGIAVLREARLPPLRRG